MEDLFARIFLGHLVGDYFLQNKKMAWMKSERSWTGFWWCTLHCLIYTLSVCLFLWTIDPLIITLVFLSHWPIDRWSLANYWLKLIGGRDYVAAWLSQEKWRELDIAFSCIVYTAADNTLHLVLLWGITKLI
ncbi:MAG: DUF3307 domain-containing protein [Candidatus Magasanikbacteria bacterium]|nr:DUF3307 domain-containing protein [Candidatus Magasanikbacteria bacterium]